MLLKSASFLMPLKMAVTSSGLMKFGEEAAQRAGASVYTENKQSKSNNSLYMSNCVLRWVVIEFCLVVSD